MMMILHQLVGENLPVIWILSVSGDGDCLPPTCLSTWHFPWELGTISMYAQYVLTGLIMEMEGRKGEKKKI
jgi:hypothetical protein